MPDLERPAHRVLPRGVTAVPDEVVAVEPDGPAVLTRSGARLTCTTLVVCPGLDEDWDDTPGLREAYSAGWAGSTFDDTTAARVWPALRRLRGSRPVHRPAGARAVRRHRPEAAVHGRRPVASHGRARRRRGAPGAAGRHAARPRSADRVLEEVLASYGVRVHARSAGRRRGRPVGHARVAVRRGGARRPRVRARRAALPRPAVGGRGRSRRRHPAGLVDIDPRTLRHRTHPAVWSLGDVADLRTRPSGGALRKQVHVLAHNVVASRDGGAVQHYDGYTVVPITTARRRLMLVEVDRTAGRRAERRPTWCDASHLVGRPVRAAAGLLCAASCAVASEAWRSPRNPVAQRDRALRPLPPDDGQAYGGRMRRLWAWLERVTAPRRSQDGWATLPPADQRGRDPQYQRYDHVGGGDV